MESEKIQTFLKNIYKELNVSPDNEEYIRYLGEKVIKAYKYAKKSNISFDEFMVRIKSLIPKFIEEYNRMSVNFSNVEKIMNTNFGVSINFELIDLFDIAKLCTDNDTFIKLRDEYFESLGRDTRIRNYDYIFPGLKDISYEEVIKIQHHVLNDVDCITPEWSGKMRCVIDTSKPLLVNNEINMEIFNFVYLDKIAKFARDNNIKLRLHNIIWHRDFMSVFENASPEQIYKFLDIYMNEISKRYGDILYSVDVLNEIASDSPDKVLRESKWLEKLGEDYYINVLRIAKKNFPNVNLFYNEYGEEREEKRKNIIEIINRIKEIEHREGIVLLDGIGIQSHYSTMTTDEQIKEAYRDYSMLGKILQVTELDVSNKGEEDKFNYQTNRVFRTVLDCVTTYGVSLVNIWGISSTISWKSGKVDNYLDKNCNVSAYSKKIVELYSKKRKISLDNEKQYKC